MASPVVASPVAEVSLPMAVDVSECHFAGQAGLHFGLHLLPLLALLAGNVQQLMGRRRSGSRSRSPARTTRREGSSHHVRVVTKPTPDTRRLEHAVALGLDAFQDPERIEEGMGGSYFFKDGSGRKVAILKPCDEEALAPNNPKGYTGRQLGEPGWKPAVRVGEAAVREVAAYLLDRDGFAGVPTSALVEASHPAFCHSSLGGGAEPLPVKLGSLQEFVAHKCDTSEMGPSRFSVRDVHRIGILDIRLFNTDRHAGNMLVKETSGSEYELVPIDHGFCLPETLEAPYFEWLHWPQAMLPFSKEELQYIKDLDIEADKELLSKELPNLRPECVRVLELTTALLKRCAEAGMTLYEIGSVMSRPFVGADEDASELEKLCLEAKQAFDAKHGRTAAIVADMGAIFAKVVSTCAFDLGNVEEVFLQQLQQYAAELKEQELAQIRVVPEPSSGALNLAAFDAWSWDLFKHELLQLLDAGIEGGKWRAAAL